jgi:hypothetical protein
MDLEAGVAGLQHDVVVSNDELVAPLDPKLIALAPQSIHGVIEGEVARSRRHVLEVEIGLLQGRQDAAEHHLGPDHLGRLAGAVDELVELLLHAAECVALQSDRIQVALHVEPAQLGREMGVVDVLEHLEGQRRRSAVGVDEKHLLLGAYAGDLGLEDAVIEHLLEGTQIGEELL